MEECTHGQGTTGHSHHGHDHRHPASGSRMVLVILLNMVITVAEYIGGLLSGSLALISDAGHNFSDVLSLIMGYAGKRYPRKGPIRNSPLASSASKWPLPW